MSRKSGTADDASVDELERQMARIACAQLCKQQGFTTVRESALNSLSEVITRSCLVNVRRLIQSYF